MKTNKKIKKIKKNWIKQLKRFFPKITFSFTRNMNNQKRVVSPPTIIVRHGPSVYSTKMHERLNKRQPNQGDIDASNELNLEPQPFIWPDTSFTGPNYNVTYEEIKLGCKFLAFLDVALNTSFHEICPQYNNAMRPEKHYTLVFASGTKQVNSDEFNTPNLFDLRNLHTTTDIMNAINLFNSANFRNGGQSLTNFTQQSSPNFLGQSSPNFLGQSSPTFTPQTFPNFLGQSLPNFAQQTLPKKIAKVPSHDFYDAFIFLSQSTETDRIKIIQSVKTKFRFYEDVVNTPTELLKKVLIFLDYMSRFLIQWKRKIENHNGSVKFTFQIPNNQRYSSYITETEVEDIRNVLLHFSPVYAQFSCLKHRVSEKLINLYNIHRDNGPILITKINAVADANTSENWGVKFPIIYTAVPRSGSCQDAGKSRDSSSLLDSPKLRDSRLIFLTDELEKEYKRNIDALHVNFSHVLTFDSCAEYDCKTWNLYENWKPCDCDNFYSCDNHYSYVDGNYNGGNYGENYNGGNYGENCTENIYGGYIEYNGHNGERFLLKKSKIEESV